MDDQQKQRAMAVIAKIQSALDQGVAHFNKEGNRLTTVAAVIDAWAHGGLTIKEEARDGSTVEEGVMTIERIQSGLAERLNIPLGVLISHKRDNRTAFARQLGYYLCRKHARASFPLIGESFNRDHSSIIHGVRTIAGRMEAEPAFRLTVKRIEHELGLFSQAEFDEFRELSSGC